MNSATKNILSRLILKLLLIMIQFLVMQLSFMLKAFKDVFKFSSMIKETLNYQKASNSKYTTVDIVEFMIDSIILGYSRFSHMDDLRYDSGYIRIKDSKIPSEKVCRGLLKAFPDEAKDEFRKLNTKLLSLQAQYEQPREVMLDFDDNV